jgi:hypothetical protein
MSLILREARNYIRSRPILETALVFIAAMLISGSLFITISNNFLTQTFMPKTNICREYHRQGIYWCGPYPLQRVLHMGRIPSSGVGVYI